MWNPFNGFSATLEEFLFTHCTNSKKFLDPSKKIINESTLSSFYGCIEAARYIGLFRIVNRATTQECVDLRLKIKSHSTASCFALTAPCVSHLHLKVSLCSFTIALKFIRDFSRLRIKDTFLLFQAYALKSHRQFTTSH